MKKGIIAVVLLVALGGYIFWNSQNQSSAPATPAPAPSPTPTTPAPTPNPAPTPVSAKYKNGTYLGPTANSIYGPVQVSATISGGKLTTVTVLQYPKDRANSAEISSRSLPILQSEAVQSQSATVDIVSGATQTSEAFTQSLASALASAQN